MTYIEIIMDEFILWLPWILFGCICICAGVVITDVIIPRFPRLKKIIDRLCD